MQTKILRLILASFICLTSAALQANAAAPMTAAQLALYQGADREKILIEGAKREGQFTLYDSHTWFRTYFKEFEKKYPFIKISECRNDSKNLIRGAREEFNSTRAIVDIVETTSEGMGLMMRNGLLQD